MRITETSLATLSPGDRDEAWVRDEKLTGFAVRLRRMADGSIKRTFAVVFQERVGGKRKMTKAFIGDWRNPWSEKDARVEAQRLLGLREKGERVVSAKRQSKGERLLSELADDFEKDCVSALKKSTSAEYHRIIAKHIRPQIGDRKVVEIRRADVRDWLLKLKETPYQGNRALAVLSSMFTYAISREWREDNPSSGVEKFPEAKREVWLDEKELPKFLKALQERSDIYAEVIRFLTVTGWRVGEALDLTWDMVDLKRLTASLPETKTGAQVRALAADAAVILDRQPHRLGFVFSTRKGTSPVGYKQLRETLTEVCKAAKVTRVTPHALRHTAATYGAMAGATTFELMRAFGWKSAAMPTRYVEKAETLSRSGAEKAAGAINVFSKPDAKVKPLKRRSATGQRRG